MSFLGCTAPKKMVFTKCSFDRTEPTIQTRTSELFPPLASKLTISIKFTPDMKFWSKKGRELILKLEPY